MILGIIAQKVMHQNLGSLVQRFILKPLRMRHTSMQTLTFTMPPPAADGYIGLPLPPKTPTPYAVSPSPSPSTFFGAGNIVSTLGDLQIWARALGTGALLQPATQRMRLVTLPTGGAVYPLPGTPSVLPISYGLCVGT